MKKIQQSLFLLPMLLLVLAACEHEMPDAPSLSAGHTYTLRLEGGLMPFAGSTRAATEWEDGATIFLQFLSGSLHTSGKAVYDAGEAVWTVTTSKALAADAEGVCEAFYFVDGTATTQRVTLGIQATAYGDTQGTYLVDEEGSTIIVHAQLAPLTGRIRFTGKAGSTFSVTGLTRYDSYNISTGEFTTSTAKVTGTLGNEGSSDYFYVVFTDVTTRTLTVEGAGIVNYRRTFGEQVLQPGSSGFVTLPTGEDLGKWTITNRNNDREITLPAVSAAEAVNVRGHAATLNATVTDLGNGTLLDAGFLYATVSSVAEETASRASLGGKTVLSVRLNGLKPLTTYYVRAYARNERGTTLGDITSLITTDGSSNSGIDRDGYDSDDDLDDGIQKGSGGSIGRDGYDDDEIWN